MQPFKAGLQTSQFLNQFLEVVGVFRGSFAGHRQLHLPLLVAHLGRFAKGLKQLFAHGAAHIHIKFLLQENDARVTLADHLAAARLF